MLPATCHRADTSSSSCGVPQLRVLPPGAPAAVFSAEPGYIGLDTYDVLDQQVVSHHFRFDRGREATHAISPHRYIWPSELDLMAQLAGLRLEARYADWDRSPFTAESRSHVSVYRLARGEPTRRATSGGR